MNFKLTIIMFLSFISVGCAQEPTEHTFVETMKVSKLVDSLASEIAKDSIYKSSAIGYSGREPEVWRIYKKLKETAEEFELEILCEHESPVVRCYSFQALVENGYKNCYKMVESHLHDTVRVKTMMGCSIWPTTVSEFYLSVVTPNQITLRGSKLKAEELKELKRKKTTYNNK